MRKNKGNHEGKYLGGVLDNAWWIYESATGFRASSVAAVTGKANYSFRIADKKVDSHSGGDYSALKEQRPELLAAIEEFFSADNAPKQNDPSDEYGDIAMSQRRTLIAPQQWKRMLLYMRLFELETTAKGEPSVPVMYGNWDAGVRMTYAGIFKFKIDDETYAQAIEYITNHSAHVDLSVLLTVIRDYFDGKYRPQSCAELSRQLDMIGGTRKDD